MLLLTVFDQMVELVDVGQEAVLHATLNLRQRCANPRTVKASP